ncbi:MAG: hypothetical protein KF894_04855 [Labilithrix sp.]|nr:hypothetical protein [Labilithrix sp.]
MSHPSSLQLEAFACGEAEEHLAPHLAACDRCRAFVERLRGALTAGPSRSTADEVVARVAAQTSDVAAQTSDVAVQTSDVAAQTSDVAARGNEHARPPSVEDRARSSRTPVRKRRAAWMTASTVAVPLAAAAALLLFLRAPSARDPLVLDPPPVAPPSAPAATGDPEPETTFKGGVQVAVIRERAGAQARFTGVVRIRPGDRLRVEVALDREQAILAAVMGDDASWVELMSEGVRRPGTHFSERSARVDASPMQGTILVGSPKAVARARSERRLEGVAAVRVEWESTP